ncbi:MAG: hypothetical protein ACAI43_05965 [Phycisphaerae bacterium]|nr:hypothetical protein [Tepidisphaeraceae bacterium]
MTRSIALSVALLGIASLAGCRQANEMRLPSFSLLQLYDPKLIIESPAPRDRIRSHLVVKFPHREDAIPSDQAYIRQICKEGTEIGATMARSLDEGTMTPEVYVKYAVWLETEVAYVYLMWTHHIENPTPPPPPFVQEIIDWGQPAPTARGKVTIQPAKDLGEALRRFEQLNQAVSHKR